VEGPGDVLRLEDNNIHNAVAIFGVSLSDQQKSLLEQSGVTDLIILLDNDEAGNRAKSILQKNLRRDFRLQFPQISGKDIGDGNKQDIEMIKELIK
jgi:DNA primase